MPFDALFVPAPLREAVSDEAWLRAMLAAERALAAAEARVGVISDADAEAVAAACAGAFDLESLIAEGRSVGNPVEPLVRALRASAERAHWGATSQDVLDTATALVARDAGALVVEELRGLAAACATLAEHHRATVMAARTLLQQAVPTTFGLKAASWLVGSVHARTRLEPAVRLPAQLGGAGGTLAALGDRGVEVLHAYAEELGLFEPVLPWHTRRLPIAELGSALAVAASFAGKIALDVELLAQTEVAEVREPAEGGSSTMPHKRNPVGSTLARACAGAGARRRGRADGGDRAGARARGGRVARGVGRSARTRWRSRAVRSAGCARRSRGWRSTRSGCARTSPPRPCRRPRAFGIDVTDPADYLGAADAFVTRALDLYDRER